MEEELTLNKREQVRLKVLNGLERKDLELRMAAGMLGISERQVWRLLAVYRKEGAAGLVHGNRGRQPANRLPREVREKVVELASGKYDGFNHSHLTEKMATEDGTNLSRSTVRRILLGEGLRSPRKHRGSRHRMRRERMAREGMLLQIDGSPHDWLEGRGPKLCLIGAIDDATNRVPYALFVESETTEGYMRLLREIVLREGLPMALYHDRHSIFRLRDDVLPSLEQQLRGEEPRTQFGRLLDELGIESIAANSPQAKGRVERLWETFQDRLSSELRLAGACTMEDANRVLADFLPEYNRRFSVQARDSQTAYENTGADFHAGDYFCLKYLRTVGDDNVVRYEGHRLQLLPDPAYRSLAGRKVEVHIDLEGNIGVFYQSNALETIPAPPEASLMRRQQRQASRQPEAQISTQRKTRKPGPDHPWRHPYKAYFD